MNWIDPRKAECEQILQNLLSAPLKHFDQELPRTLPTRQGLYAISTIGAAEGEYLHVGKSKDGRNGLRGRVWDQHFQTGGSSGDLIEKVKKHGKAGSAREAKEYIRRNCQVQWVTLEDATSRGWAEHYILAVLRPLWGN